ncbi:MAG TPA: coenzyme F420-0:L-glutamate ligase [Thermomicrobiales bacterium]|nr:coenzyme F420-0:L-glutamate ligase [Thermomicrobiales bacterium]
MPAEIRVFGLDGIPEIRAGDDLVDAIATALDTSGLSLEDGDILVVTHKIVSKAEDRLVDLATITPSAFALAYAERTEKDPRQVEVVLREAKRVVRMDRGVLICETRHGFICANAGVDASNVPGDHTVCLLPLDPDASARRIREGLAARYGAAPAVIISDSFGRPWRRGIVNVAIGLAGMSPFADYRGVTDAYGYDLRVSVMAVADELAATAELLAGKTDARPVALIRGYPYTSDPDASAGDLVMDAERDLFR